MATTLTTEQKEHVIAFIIEYDVYTDIPASSVMPSDIVVSYTNPDNTTGNNS